jgi:hypothetical protein
MGGWPTQKGTKMAKANKAQKPATPVAPATPAPTLPLSPVIAPVGKSVKGAHIQAWRAALKAGFAPTATLALVQGSTNPWHAGKAGHTFYTAVLAKGPATVQAAITLGATVGFTKANVLGHLAWLYTWGPFVTINGNTWAQAQAAPTA